MRRILQADLVFTAGLLCIMVPLALYASWLIWAALLALLLIPIAMTLAPFIGGAAVVAGVVAHKRSGGHVAFRTMATTWLLVAGNLWAAVAIPSYTWRFVRRPLEVVLDAWFTVHAIVATVSLVASITVVFLFRRRERHLLSRMHGIRPT